MKKKSSRAARFWTEERSRTEESVEHRRAKLASAGPSGLNIGCADISLRRNFVFGSRSRFIPSLSDDEQKVALQPGAQGVQAGEVTLDSVGRQDQGRRAQAVDHGGEDRGIGV
jgi:hypothetical protein